MTAVSIPVGSGVTAFFVTTTHKVDGKRVKENLILAISIDSWGTRKIAEERQGIMYCTKSSTLSFHAF